MARPSKYNWTSIKEAYEKGFEKDEIVKKFKIPKAILTNKINSENWTVLCDVKADIHELNATSHKIAQNYTQNPDIEEMFIEKVTTQIEDNELIQNNRKLAKAFQGLIGQGIRGGTTYKTASDIRAGVGALKDIESIANPQASKTDIQINNTNAQQNVVKTLDDFYEDINS